MQAIKNKFYKEKNKVERQHLLDEVVPSPPSIEEFRPMPPLTPSPPPIVSNYHTLYPNLENMNPFAEIEKDKAKQKKEVESGRVNLKKMYKQSHRENNYTLWKKYTIRIIRNQRLKDRFKFYKLRDYHMIKSNLYHILTQESDEEINDLLEISRFIFNDKISVVDEKTIMSLLGHQCLDDLSEEFLLEEMPTVKQLKHLIINHQEKSIKLLEKIYKPMNEIKFKEKKNIFVLLKHVNSYLTLLEIIQDLYLTKFERAFLIVTLLTKTDIIENEYEELLEEVPINFIYIHDSKTIDYADISTYWTNNMKTHKSKYEDDCKSESESDIESDSDNDHFIHHLHSHEKIDMVKKLLKDPKLDINYYCANKHTVTYDFLQFRRDKLFKMALERDDNLVSYENNILLKCALKLNNKVAANLITKHPNFISNKNMKDLEKLV